MLKIVKRKNYHQDYAKFATMKKRKLKIIIALMTGSVIGLTAVQFIRCTKFKTTASAPFHKPFVS